MLVFGELLISKVSFKFGPLYVFVCLFFLRGTGLGGAEIGSS